MSRTILALLLFVLFGVGLTLFFEQDNGYVLLRYGDLVVETSIVFFAIVLVLGLWLLLLGWRALRLGLGVPQWLPELYQRYRNRSARRSLLRGLVLLREGHWPAAEKELAKRIGTGDARLVNHLYAAIAAQRQNAPQRRDYYLQQAAETADAELAVLLTQAQLQIEAEQHTQAVASLELLREKQPEHGPALGLLLDLTARLGDWPRVRELWPDAQRLKVAPENSLDAVATQAYGDLLTESAAQGLEALDAAWQSLPRRLRQHDALLVCYVRLLARDAKGHAEALRQITATLKQRWQPQLALLYAELESENGTSQLAAVEGWIKQYGEQAELQLLAGQLCLRNKLWGRSRSYLEAAIKHHPSAAAWRAMGKLNEQTGDIGAAAQAYANGLQLALHESATAD